MSARKNQHIAFDGAHAIDNAIGTGSNLFGRFSVRAAVTEQLPVRSLRVNLRCAETFVITIVPLDQITIDLSYGAEACQLTSSRGALQRARQHFCENRPGQPFSQAYGVAFAPFGQRQVGNPRVLTGYAPGSLAVTRQINYGKNFAHISCDSSVSVVRFQAASVLRQKQIRDRNRKLCQLRASRIELQARQLEMRSLQTESSRKAGEKAQVNR